MPKKILLALCALVFLSTAPALADDHRGRRGQHWQGDHDDGDRRWVHEGRGKHHKHKTHHKKRRHGHGVVWHGERRWHPEAGHRHRHGRHYHRHGHGHGRGHGRGHGQGHDHGRGVGHADRHGHVGERHRFDRHRRHDDWAVYAILALQIVDVLNESQRDSFAWAQQRAVTAPLGDTIRWNEGGARGSVVATRDGSDTAGRYCREFQQEVVIGNRRESSYGIACRQPGGDWEIVS